MFFVSIVEIAEFKPCEVARKVELNVKSTRLGLSVGNAYLMDGVAPMDLSYAEAVEDELQAAEQRDVRRCHICGSMSYLQSKYSARLRRPGPPQRFASKTTVLLLGGNAK